MASSTRPHVFRRFDGVQRGPVARLMSGRRGRPRLPGLPTLRPARPWRARRRASRARRRPGGGRRHGARGVVFESTGAIARPRGGRASQAGSKSSTTAFRASRRCASGPPQGAVGVRPQQRTEGGVARKSVALNARSPPASRSSRKASNSREGMDWSPSRNARPPSRRSSRQSAARRPGRAWSADTMASDSPLLCSCSFMLSLGLAPPSARPHLTTRPARDAGHQESRRALSGARGGMKDANGGGDRTRTCKPEGGGFQDRCITNYATPPRVGCCGILRESGRISMGARATQRVCANRTQGDPETMGWRKPIRQSVVCCFFGRFLEPATRIRISENGRSSDIAAYSLWESEEIPFAEVRLQPTMIRAFSLGKSSAIVRETSMGASCLRMRICECGA